MSGDMWTLWLAFMVTCGLVVAVSYVLAWLLDLYGWWLRRKVRRLYNGQRS